MVEGETPIPDAPIPDVQNPDVRALKARYVFPVAGQPIADGVVTIEAGRIVAVGKEPAARPLEDLGNVAILPGLVNAHTHLDFSGLSEPLGHPGIAFVDWLRRVVKLRIGRRPQRAESGERQPVQRGLEECLRHGTTALGDIAQPGWPVEEVAAAPLEATIFLELIAPTAARVAGAVELAQRHLDRAKDPAAYRPGLSPHAPYSVHPELLAQVVSLSQAQRVPIAMHLAETREELELLRSASGPFRLLLDQFGAYDPRAIPPAARPLDYLHGLAAAHRALVIHGNYLDDEEIGFLGKNSQHMAVVYCPRSHAYFRHDRYPLGKMLSAGVTVALGTDGRASSPDLSLLAEMRFVAGQYTAVDRQVILRLGTIEGAKALGRDQEIGSLEPGKRADLAVVSLPNRGAGDPHDLLFDSALPVAATCCKGKIVAGTFQSEPFQSEP